MDAPAVCPPGVCISAHRRRLVYWALPNRLKEPGDPTIDWPRCARVLRARSEGASLVPLSKLLLQQFGQRGSHFSRGRRDGDAGVFERFDLFGSRSFAA